MGSSKERDHLRDTDVGWRIILKQTLEKYGVRVWTELNSRQVPKAGSCTKKRNNEPLGSGKEGEFLNILITISFSRQTQNHGVSSLR
jgi:hypothetical protein